MCALCIESREPINYKNLPVWVVLNFLGFIKGYFHPTEEILRKDWFIISEELYLCKVYYNTQYGLMDSEFYVPRYL